MFNCHGSLLASYLNKREVGRIRDAVEGLHNFREFSLLPECLDEAM